MPYDEKNARSQIGEQRLGCPSAGHQGPLNARHASVFATDETSRAAMVVPTSSMTPSLRTWRTRRLVRRHSPGSEPAGCHGICSMALAGRAASPQANMRRTYGSTRLEAPIRGSRQTPWKKGTRKRVIMEEIGKASPVSIPG
ncbi:hypothetical protein [Desulfosarcina alkanivorans]|uniref:hypothetical protein n=1 Tax=Desulfosarcina alkanivorans TaxID=571177 RepID=UPI0012D350DD|nr:hypothetical protein [Desulfosarcina alkanivorans]